MIWTNKINPIEIDESVGINECLIDEDCAWNEFCLSESNMRESKWFCVKQIEIMICDIDEDCPYDHICQTGETGQK